MKKKTPNNLGCSDCAAEIGQNKSVGTPKLLFWMSKRWTFLRAEQKTLKYVCGCGQNGRSIYFFRSEFLVPNQSVQNE